MKYNPRTAQCSEASSPQERTAYALCEAEKHAVKVMRIAKGFGLNAPQITAEGQYAYREMLRVLGASLPQNINDI